MQRVQINTSLGRLLDWCQEQEATDLHCQTERPYHVRIHGEISPAPIEIFPPPSQKEIYRHLRENFTPFACERIESECEVDLSFYFETQRYRANFSKQQGEQSFWS